MTRAFLLTIAALCTTASAASYTVKAGDTLASIAQANQVAPEALMSRNHLSTPTVQVGQVLELSASTFTKTNTPKTNTTASSVVANGPQAPAKVATVTPARSGGATITTAASRFLGIRYVHGGTSSGGLDCSGFTMRVFQQMGISLPRTAAAQYRTGIAVSSRNLRTGDLVFFNTTGRVASHVGIYLGNGMMANANSAYGRTMVEPLFSNPYWASRYIGARRVLS